MIQLYYLLTELSLEPELKSSDIRASFNIQELAECKLKY